MLQPIETNYRGYRFRSRTEARWAVFFDTLGIEWQYESEGYKLPSGEWYLPDFYIPRCPDTSTGLMGWCGSPVWFEVKPHAQADISKPIEMAHELMRQCNVKNAGMIVVAGCPNERVDMWERATHAGIWGSRNARWQSTSLLAKILMDNYRPWTFLAPFSARQITDGIIASRKARF